MMGASQNKAENGKRVTWAEEAEVLAPARMARFLRFLFRARRWEGITKASAAIAANTRSCNLSAFISTEGEKRNISPARTVQILSWLGVHPSGQLAPGLHRWDLGGAAESDIAVFCELMRANRVSANSPGPAAITLSHGECYLLHRVNRLTTLMARFPAETAERVCGEFDRLTQSQASGEESTELQTLWSTKHNWVVERAVDTYTRKPSTAGTSHATHITA